MEYKLLNNNKGVILTRQPEFVDDTLYITFSGAPENATAILEKQNGDSLYLKLEDNTCAVRNSFLEDILKITLVVLDGRPNSLKWVCEEIKITKHNNGVFVCPNDMNLPGTVVEVLVELHEMRGYMRKLDDKYSELNKKLEKLLEGYDIV